MTPDGYEVQVRADSQQAALDQVRGRHQEFDRVITRDGQSRVLQSPSTGAMYYADPNVSFTDPERVQRVLNEMQVGRGEGAGAEETRRGFLQDVLDQVGGATATAQEFLRGTPFIGSRVDEALGAVLGEDAQRASRITTEAMQELRPGTTAAANIAGGITTSALGALAAPQAVTGALGRAALGGGGRSILGQTARAVPTAAALGGLEGAVYGYGEGTGAENRAQAATEGGLLGAALGGGIGLVAPTVTRVGQNIADYLRRSDVDQIASTLGISSNAARVIRNTFDQGGGIPEAVEGIQRAGDEAMLADAGPAAQALLDAAAQSGGPAARTARDAITGRTERVLDATQGQLRETLGEAPLGPRAAITQIRDRTRDARREAYDQAYSTPIVYASDQGRAIEAQLARIDPAVLSDAIQTANERMRGAGVRNQQIMARIGDDGEVVFEEMPNVQQLDYIKRALDRRAEMARNDLGMATDDTRFYGGLASDLRNAIRDAVPSYGNALRLGGETIQDENAFRLGAQLLRPGTEVEDVLDELGDEPSATQLEALRTGLSRQINKILGDVRGVPSDPDLAARQLDQLLRVTSSENARRKIQEVLGDQAAPLLRQLDQVSQTALVRTAMSQNSRTAARQAIQRSVEDITAPGPLGSLARGEPLNTSKELIRIVSGQTDEYTEVQRQRIFDDIARALTQRGDRTAEEVLRLMRGAMQGQSLTEAQNEFVARYVTFALGLGGGTATGRAAAREE